MTRERVDVFISGGGIAGLAAALDLIAAVGQDNIQARVEMLTRLLTRILIGHGWDVFSPGSSHPIAGIVAARHPSVSPDDARRVAGHLETAGLPTNLNAMKKHLRDADTMLDYIRQDKKVTRGALNFILTRGIGQSFIARDVPESEVRAFLVDKIGA